MRRLNLKSISNFWKFLSVFSIAVLLISAHVADSATIYPAGSLLQPNDVTSSHIRDNTIVNSDVSSSAGIIASKINPGSTDGLLLFASSSKLATSTNFRYSTTTGDLYIFNGRIHATSTNFNGVNYTWPSADGSANATLSTNGAGVLSWAQSTPTTLIATTTAGEDITAGQAVYIEPTARELTAENSGTNNFGTNGSCGNNTRTECGQSFIAGSTVAVTKIVVGMMKSGTPSDNVIIGIQADSAGVPSGTYLSSGTVSGASLATSITNYTITLSASVNITSGVKYWVVITRSGAQDVSNNYVLGLNSAATYEGGNYWAKVSGTWQSVVSNSIVYQFKYNTIVGRAYKADSSNTYSSYSYLGLATANISAGSTGNVYTFGEVTGLSGLTTGTLYYLGTGGSLSTSAGTVPYKVGFAKDAYTIELFKSF